MKENDLRNNLRQIRLRPGMSQQDLATLAGVSRQTIGGVLDNMPPLLRSHSDWGIVGCCLQLAALGSYDTSQTDEMWTRWSQNLLSQRELESAQKIKKTK